MNTTDILTLAGGIDKLEFVRKLEVAADGEEYVSLVSNGLVSKYFLFGRDPLRYVRVSLFRRNAGDTFVVDALTGVAESHDFPGLQPHQKIKDELSKMFD